MSAPFPVFQNDSLAIAASHELGFKHVSPLPYSGGKARQIRYLSTLMPAKIDYLFDAFMGGLSTSIFLIKSGRVKPENCFAGDVSKPLINFFHVLQSDYEALTLKLAEDSVYHSNGSQHLFEEAIAILNSPASDLELARAFYIFSKTSMSHAWEFRDNSFAPSKIGPNEGITLPQIFRLPRFGALLAPVNISEWDYSEALQAATRLGKGAFVFADSPYEGRDMELYGVEFDFDRYAEQCHKVANQCTFMLTINDSPENRERFKGFNIIERQQYYSGAHKPNGAELVICNYELDAQDCYLKWLGYRRVK